MEVLFQLPWVTTPVYLGWEGREFRANTKMSSTCYLSTFPIKEGVFVRLSSHWSAAPAVEHSMVWHCIFLQAETSQSPCQFSVCASQQQLSAAFIQDSSPALMEIAFLQKHSDWRLSRDPVVPKGLSGCTEIPAEVWDCGHGMQYQMSPGVCQLAETHSCLLIHSQQTLRFHLLFI